MYFKKNYFYYFSSNLNDELIRTAPYLILPMVVNSNLRLATFNGGSTNHR